MKGSFPIHKYIHDVYKISLSQHTIHTQHTQSICVWYRRIKAPPNFGGAFAFVDDIEITGVILFIIVFRLVRDVVANHKTTRYAGAATKVIQKNHLA